MYFMVENIKNLKNVFRFSRGSFSLSIRSSDVSSLLKIEKLVMKSSNLNVNGRIIKEMYLYSNAGDESGRPTRV